MNASTLSLQNVTFYPFNKTNNTTNSSPYIAYSKDLDVWFAVNLTLGIVGSLLLVALICAILLGHRSNRNNSTTLLIIHLLAIEFIICSTLMPHQSITIYWPNLRMFRVGCTYNYFAWMLTMSGAQWSTCFLALNRAVAILIPHAYEKLANIKSAVLTIILAWLIPFVIYFPFFLGFGGFYDAIPPWMSCGIRTDPGFKWASSVMTPFGFYIPLAITGSGYFVILICLLGRNLRKHHVVPIGVDPVTSRRNAIVNGNLRRRRLAIAKMLFASALWYCACYLPNIVIVTSFFGVFMRNPPLQLWLRTIFFLGYIGNPVGKKTC